MFLFESLNGEECEPSLDPGLYLCDCRAAPVTGLVKASRR